MNQPFLIIDRQKSAKPDGPSRRLPDWLKQDIPVSEGLERARGILDKGISTVCVQAKCPNSSKCFRAGQLTFMILGPVCTRNCRFCAVEKSKNAPLQFDEDEPDKIARTVKELKIAYAVVTSVCRDDLVDGGAGQFSRTIQAIRNTCPGTAIEVLIPDFQGKTGPLKLLVDAGAEVIGHNLETISRLYPRLRPRGDYRLALQVLSRIKELKNSAITKSSLMLGLSETADEVNQAMRDLRQSGCDILTLGQYLAPSPEHEPVREFITPGRFSEYREIALRMGFKAVLAGPLVRSSYLAEKIYTETINA